MKFHHRFQVNAPLSEVAAFHRLAASMGAITPPPIRVEVHRTPAELSSDSEMEFSLYLGPFHFDWLARIEDVSEAGFIDRQLQGPFHEWTHRHSFLAVDENITEVDDLVVSQAKRSLGWRLIGFAIWLGMPYLFAFRSRKTRSLLER